MHIWLVRPFAWHAAFGVQVDSRPRSNWAGNRRLLKGKSARTAGNDRCRPTRFAIWGYPSSTIHIGREKNNDLPIQRPIICARRYRPLRAAAFASPTTARRCAVKLIHAIASQLQWAIRAVDISQAFLLSSNLRPNDRVDAIPPTTIRQPWAG